MMAHVKCVSDRKEVEKENLAGSTLHCGNFAIMPRQLQSTMLPASPHSASLHMKIYPACNGSVIIVDYTSFFRLSAILNNDIISTFIWKFYHVINKSATVYPLAGNMFTACYLLYRVKILTISGTPLQKLRRITYTSAAIIVYRTSRSSVPVRTTF